VRETIVKKTVCLFEVAFVFGWLYGGGDPARLPELKKAAEHFGLVFQILDDFGDQAQDIENARQINVPNLLGRTQAQELLKKEMQAYAEAMKGLNLTTPGLLALEGLLSQQVVTVSQSDGAVR
jgi:geranylgeranyl diphosphate synthase type II